MGKHKMVIHTSSPEGNAWVIMGYVRSYMRQTGAAPENIEAAMTEMRRKDYKYLCEKAQEFTNGFIEVVEDLEDEDDYV